MISIVCATLRLVPVRWSWRKFPVQRLTWPAFAVGFVVMTAWFLHSVIPYSVAAFDHPSHAALRILHVTKHGLRFHETSLKVYRDGRFYTSRSDRGLFRYRFASCGKSAALAEASPGALSHARALVQSPTLWNLRTPPPKAPRAWNAEGWYVVLKDSRVLSFTTDHGTSPPAEVTELFHEIEGLPASSEHLFIVRDVCLGFCYDPVAALGFSVLSQRARLLSAPGYDGL